MKSLSVRCLFGNMKVEKLGKTAKNFGLPGSNTKITTSPKLHLFEGSVFSTGVTADAATSAIIRFLIFINGKNEVAFDNVALLSHSSPLHLTATTGNFGQRYDMGLTRLH